MRFTEINILKNKYDGLIKCHEDLEWALSNDKTECIVINTDYITYISEPETCVEYYKPNNVLGRYFYVHTKGGEIFACKESEYDRIVLFLTCCA